MAGIGHRGFFRRKGNEPQEPFFTFKTEFNGEVSFEITKSGIPATWYMGDGTVYTATDSVTHTYADGSEKEVFVSVDNFDNVTGLGSFANKQITEADFSNLSFIGGSILIGDNPLILLGLNSSFQNDTQYLNVSNTLLTTLNFSGIKNFTGGTGIQRGVIASGCPNLLIAIAPNIINSAAFNADFSNCPELINFDLSPISGTQANVNISQCSSLTNPIFPTTNSCNITAPNSGITALDLPVAGLGDLNVDNCTDLVSFSAPIANTSSKRIFTIQNTALSSLDLQAQRNLSSAGSGATGVRIRNNPNLNEILLNTAFYATTAGGINISNNGTIPDIDISIINLGLNGVVNLSDNGLNDIIRNGTNGKAGQVVVSGNPLNYFDLSNWFEFDIQRSSSSSNYWHWTNCSLSAELVNHFLVDIDANSTSQTWSRVVDFTGSNAAPDSSSGGFDGLAAKASLIAKGFTVLTN